MSDPHTPPDPQAAAAIAKVKRLMLVASLTTLIALAAVFGVIGYRVFHWQGSAPLPPPPGQSAEATLPAGAKVISTAVGDGHVVLTVEVDGAVELLSFDLRTLRPLGRVRLASKP
jgi:hypothetical protein